jgi:uncharacterized membrane protein HdeD (DUF308 family)
MAAVSGVIPTVRGEIRQSATWSIVLSVLMIVSGVLAIAIPPVAGLTVTVMVGWLLVVTGALHLGFAWRGHGTEAVIGELAVAVLYGAIGFYLLARPLAGLASLTLAIAAYLVAKGVLESVVAFKLRMLPGTGWLVFDGILTVVIAALIAAAWPASSAWVIGVLVGVAMVSSGFSRLMVSTTVRRLAA